MKEPLSPSQLCDYVNGFCTPAEQEAIQALALTDPELRERISSLQGFKAAAAKDREDAAPELWLARAKALLLPQPQAPTLLQTIASLVWDSRSAPAMGLRSTASDLRSATYRAGRVGVDVRAVPSSIGGQFDIIGVVYDAESDDAAGLTAEIQGPESAKLVKTSPYGEFKTRVKSDRPELLIHTGLHPQPISLPLSQLLSDEDPK
jgi:hypothetical protein